MRPVRFPYRGEKLVHRTGAAVATNYPRPHRDCGETGSGVSASILSSQLTNLEQDSTLASRVATIESQFDMLYYITLVTNTIMFTLLNIFGLLKVPNDNIIVHTI